MRQLLSQKHDQDLSEKARYGLNERGRSAAIREANVLIEEAARSALDEFVAVLQEATGERLAALSSPRRPGGREDPVEPVLAFARGRNPKHSVVLAKTGNYYAPLGRGKERLMTWSSPTDVLLPCWLLYDDMGGSRSPSIVIQGGIAVTVTQQNVKTGEHAVAFNGCPFGFSRTDPLKLANIEDVRDYWLKAAARVFDIDL